MDLSRLLDPGLIITGIAAVIAFGWGSGQWKGRGTWLRHLLLASWVASALTIATNPDMPTMVFVAASMDFIVAFASVMLLAKDNTRNDARTVGAISLALMPAHLAVSVCQGLTYGGWPLYAAACNGAFIIQCLVVRGWLDGLGRTFAGFLGRLRRLPLLRFRGR